jgi:hypothetical protein
MFSLKSALVLLVLWLLISGIAVAFQTKRRIANGVWGGPHISIKVGADSAAVEYDCANGVINGPLRIDADGRFAWRGVHRMERGGPVRADEKPAEHPATYTGSITGNTMKLTLKVEDLDAETFTLEKGRPGELFKCK